MNREIWKDIPGYDKLYWVSNQGRVRSLKYGKEQILKPGKHRQRGGYLSVVLCKAGKRKMFRVHRLVWSAFNGPIPEGYEINHNDENPENNCLDNLSLMTRTENINWGTHNRRVTKALRRMVEQYALDGTHICTWFSVMGIEREFGYSQGNISSCCNGKRKTAYGFIWKYVI